MMSNYTVSFLFLIISSSLSNIFVAAFFDSASLMQRGLRGAKTQVDTSSEFVEVDGKGKTNLYSDDDESCAADGLTPGVCALAGLARAPAESLCTDCTSTQSERLERALISEIESAFQGTHIALNDKRLIEIEDDLWPLYSTLPQEVDGAGLGLSSARFMLHTYFTRKHRWYVKGLNPAGEGRKEESPSEVLRGQMAGQLLEMLEKQVSKRGLSLKVLSVFVATLEHLIRGDERERLKTAWQVHNLKNDDAANEQLLRSVLEVFLGHYLFVSQQSRSGYALTLEKAKAEVEAMEHSYDGWDEIKRFVQEAVEKQIIENGPTVNLTNAIEAADEVLEKFNALSGLLCGAMKAHFTMMPDGMSGHIPLAKLRIAAGKDFFRESTTYLRHLGALDEADRSNPKVIIPNYLLGPSNCDGKTSFYNLCCPNECEQHIGAFEQALASNQKENHANIILSKFSAKNGFGGISKLSDDMKSELETMARKSNGRINLHGRPFAQWMHKLYPRECPQPRSEDFKSGDDVPDAHVSFHAAAGLPTWDMSAEELQTELQAFGGLQAMETPTWKLSAKV
jgi:hypothetical protein